MKNYAILLILISIFACSNDRDETTNPDPVVNTNFKYLALGDSYTIGQSVCNECSFPAQLRSSLALSFPDNMISLDIIAQTGWTTTNLLEAIEAENPGNDHDLVTLLIGVNNQYQQKPFSLFEAEFPLLLSKAVELAGGNAANVIVVSIPDYAYTPFGQGFSNPMQISSQIDQYNNFAEQHAAEFDVRFIYITDITRNGLEDPALVASDGLHPSETAYAEFVARLKPEAEDILGN